MQFSVAEGTINPKYAPDFEDCYEHVEEAFLDDLYRKMMATGYCDEWESNDYGKYITVHVDVDKNLDKVAKALLKATMSEPDTNNIKNNVRSKKASRVRDIVWDEEVANKRIERIYQEDVILFRSEQSDDC